MFKVALVYNLKKENKDPGLPEDFYSEFDSPKTIASIANALKAGGNEVVLVESDSNLIQNLKDKGPFDIAFNIAEGTGGHSRESQVPAMLEYLRMPYTGSSVMSLAVSLDKAMTKRMLMYEGLPTPRFLVIKSTAQKLDSSMRFPMIVKPNCEGSAKGITLDSFVEDEKTLYREVARITSNYGQEALVEEYIDGMEITVAVLGNEDIRVFMPMEIDFSNCRESGEFFYSWRMKEYQGNKEMHLVPEFHCPARVDKQMLEKIMDVAKKTYQALGCFDLSRVDIRLGKDNVPYVLEINPLPGLDPNDSNFTTITRACGMAYNDLINDILRIALKRYGITKSKYKAEPALRR